MVDLMKLINVADVNLIPFGRFGREGAGVVIEHSEGRYKILIPCLTCELFPTNIFVCSQDMLQSARDYHVGQ